MFGGISVWQLLILLVVVILIFGTKKLRTLGGDLGGAVKGFKSAMNDGGASLDLDQESALKENETDKLGTQTKDAMFSKTTEKHQQPQG
ncbi:Sec-independent protein translocase TatA [Bermanella sp. 47_1433_sub80_T6]|nr:Sec-independent protein translocase TatA [Bermanella sp. 47_1433_sub80_T6]